MHRNLRTGVTLAAAVALALVACSRQAPEAESSADAAMVAETAPAAAPMAVDAAGGMAANQETAKRVAQEPLPTAQQMVSAAATYTDAQRKFIRTAHAQFRVADVYRSALAIEDAATALGGFVTKNGISAQIGAVQRRPMGEGKLLELAEYTVRGELVVRVPSEKTQDLLRGIVEQMQFLDSRDFEAMDAQFDLLRQRLAYERGQQAQQELGAAAAQGGRLSHRTEAIGARSDAKLARDEAMVAQKEFEDRIAFSTIRLSLYQLPQIRRAELTDVEAVFEQNSPGFFARLGSALSVGWHGALNVLIEFAKVWPLWLAGIVAFVGYRKLLRRGRAK